MKIQSVFGVGTARYLSLHPPFLCLENEENDQHYIVDTPLCCGIARWDVRKKHRQHYIHAHSDSLTCMICVSQIPYLSQPQLDDDLQSNLGITTSFSGEISTWNVSSWTRLDTTRIQRGKVMHIALNYTANKLVVSSEEGEGLVSILSIDEHGKLQQMKEIAGSYMFCEFNEAGNIIAVKQKRGKSKYNVKLVELDENGNVVKTLSLKGKDEVNMIKRNEKGYIALARGRSIEVVDPNKLEVVWVTQTDGCAYLRDFMFYKNNFLTPTDGGGLILWHETTKVKQWKGKHGVVYSLRWAKLEERVWICDESGIHMLSLNSDENLSIKEGYDWHLIRFHEMTCCGIDFGEDANLVACGDFGGQVLIWSMSRHQPVTSTRFEMPVRSLCWRTGPGQPIYIGLMDGAIYEWIPKLDGSVETHNTKLVASMMDSVTCLQLEYGNEPKFLAAGATDGTLAVFCAKPGEQLLRIHWAIKAHKPNLGPQDLNFGSLHKFAEIWSLCWSPDNKYLATASEDQRARIWDASCGDFVRELTGHTSAVTCVDWQTTKLGNILATCGDDRKIYLWNTDTWDIFHVFETSEIDDWHTATYLAIERGGKGTRIACVTQNGWLFMWDIETKQKIFKRRLHLGSIEGLKWHPVSGLLATCASDCVVNIIDTKGDVVGQS
jgi:WD40 repeat protein